MFLNKVPFLRVVASVLCLLTVMGCNKYLDLKPNPKQVEPTTLNDLQALMDSYESVNISCPALLVVASDEYYLLPGTYTSRIVDVQNNYIWNADATDIIGWQRTYQGIYYCNLVLDRLEDISNAGSNLAAYNNIKGQALFFRGFINWHLAQLYCKPYAMENLGAPGIALRTRPDITIKTARSTIEQTYSQIINDLKAALELLPDKSIGITRPAKAAAYGALARTYLSMRDYNNSAIYADSSLKKVGLLIDYNTVSTTSTSPFDPYSGVNPEDLLLAVLPASGVPTSSSLVDTVLYASYDSTDLRKTIFFAAGNGGYYLKGSYAGGASGFNGIATDEMYLIRSECAARNGNKDSALADVNRLLVKRYKTNKYTPLTTANTPDVLAKILIERRKELVYRGLRWSDIRRLNMDGANITLKRDLSGTSYTLPANDLRTVMLIPREVINQTSIEQNPR